MYLVLKEVKLCQLKLDRGSKTTGIAILQGNKLIWAAELTHRDRQIKEDLESRRFLRLSRRGRKTRYRKPRFPYHNSPLIPRSDRTSSFNNNNLGKQVN